MADRELPQLDETTELDDTDLLYVVTDPGGEGEGDARITGANLRASVVTAGAVAAVGACFVFVHDGAGYTLAGGRIFVGPEDPEDDGFVLADGDEWVATGDVS